ncbi:hypothetical protein BNATCHR199 (nucleomorph) [Bigelowiella natans]|uniref:Uncharacterized protein n=1 Tax=Bigelowiella natans TaxID=227086 RepID=Q3LWI0_BIGNA|nr:hypothetical protein BNATCHR199 [Bigelowiella natans]ABA27186.1 hypothetical protein [Bigelowiella natans]
MKIKRKIEYSSRYKSYNALLIFKKYLSQKRISWINLYYKLLYLKLNKESIILENSKNSQLLHNFKNKLTYKFYSNNFINKQNLEHFLNNFESSYNPPNKNWLANNLIKDINSKTWLTNNSENHKHKRLCYFYCSPYKNDLNFSHGFYHIKGKLIHHTIITELFTHKTKNLKNKKLKMNAYFFSFLYNVINILMNTSRSQKNINKIIYKNITTKTDINIIFKSIVCIFEITYFYISYNKKFLIIKFKKSQKTKNIENLYHLIKLFNNHIFMNKIKVE